MIEFLLVMIMDVKGGQVVSFERFATEQECRTVEKFIKTNANEDSSNCFKVQKLGVSK